MKHLFIYSIYLILIFPCFLTAQNKEVVICEGSCIGENLTPYEARRRALASARIEAIKRVVGLEITEETFRKLSEINTSSKQKVYDSFYRLTNTKSAGRIIKEKILSWHTELLNNIPIYNVKIEATVVIDNSSNDPSFKVNIFLEDDVLIAGKDELKFKITATQDCFIFLFNLMGNDSVQIVLPNQYVVDNYYQSSEKYQQFEHSFDELGITFPVSLREGINKDYEALYVVALKDKKDALSFPFQNENLQMTLSASRAFTELQSWLINISKDKRTEAINTFEIRSKKNDNALYFRAKENKEQQ